MIKKIFDTYYIVLERAINEMNAPGMMGGSIALNVISLFMIFGGFKIFSESIYFIAIVLLAILFVLSIIFSFRYRKKRTEKLRQKYAETDEHTRQSWIAGVIAYEVLTVILFLLSLWLTAKNVTPQEVLPFTLPELHPRP